MTKGGGRSIKGRTERENVNFISRKRVQAFIKTCFGLEIAKMLLKFVLL